MRTLSSFQISFNNNNNNHKQIKVNEVMFSWIYETGGWVYTRKIILLFFFTIVLLIQIIMFY